MSRFREEMRVIPHTAWVIGLVCYVALAVVAWIFFIPVSGSAYLAKAAFALVVPMFWLTWVLLIGYVNGDARRRGMRYVLWTLLAIFIPNAIGIILYFILREPPMRACPKCGSLVRGGFAFCQACGSVQTPTCSACRRAVESDWSHCPHCGTGLRAA